MLQLLREGYWRDVLVLFLVTALLGTFAVAGAGRAVAAYFEGAVESIAGSPGEFDLIVHVRPESEAGAAEALRRRLEAITPDYTLKVGPVIAGRVHLLAGFPEEVESRSLFESLSVQLQSIPGYDGMTFMVEPSVLMKDVHPELVDRLRDEAASLPQVRFAFHHAGTIWAVLDSAEAAAAVKEELDRRVAPLGLVEARFPVPVASEALVEAERSLVERASESLPLLSPTLLEREESALSEGIAALRRLLAQLGEGEAVRRSLSEAASLLEQVDASGSAEEAREVIATFRQALSQVEEVQLQLESVAAQLRGAAQEGEATDILIAMLLQRLFDGLGVGGVPTPPAPAVDVASLEAGLSSIEERLRQLDSLELAEFARSLRALEQSFPLLPPEELARIEEHLDRLDASAGGGDRLELLVEGDWSEERLLAFAREALGESVQAWVHPAAVVEPDARTSVLRLLQRAQGVVTALLSLCLALVVLFTDCATLVSYCKKRAEAAYGKRSASFRLGVNLFGAAWGALLLALFVRFGGGSEISPVTLAAVGFIAGLIVAAGASRISPVDVDPVHAGLSLGMSEAEIVREVIVPGSRPGLLFLLNRWWRRGVLRTGRDGDAAAVPGG